MRPKSSVVFCSSIFQGGFKTTTPSCCQSNLCTFVRQNCGESANINRQDSDRGDAGMQQRATVWNHTTTSSASSKWTTCTTKFHTQEVYCLCSSMCCLVHGSYFFLFSRSNFSIEIMKNLLSYPLYTHWCAKLVARIGHSFLFRCFRFWFQLPVILNSDAFKGKGQKGLCGLNGGANQSSSLWFLGSFYELYFEFFTGLSSTSI